MLVLKGYVCVYSIDRVCVSIVLRGCVCVYSIERVCVSIVLRGCVCHLEDRVARILRRDDRVRVFAIHIPTGRGSGDL